MCSRSDQVLKHITIVSLLLTLMADLCLSLSAGEDAFELHSVQLELEAVERQINELLERQAQLRERQTALETSRADTHKSAVSILHAANTPTTSTPCVSLHLGAAAAEDASQASGYNISPSAASGLRDLNPEPLRPPPRDGT